jgi:hypothetical protein
MTTIPLTTLLWSVVTLALFCGLAALTLALRRLRDDSARRFAAIEARLSKLESRGEKEMPKVVASGSRAKPIPSATRRTDRTASRGRTLISVPAVAGSPPASVPPDDLARRFGAIWDLAEAGASPESIARDTGQPIGQVELILGLKRPRASSSSGGLRLP